MEPRQQFFFFFKHQARMIALDLTSVVKTYFAGCYDLRSMSQVEDYLNLLTMDRSELHPSTVIPEVSYLISSEYII